MGLIDRGGWSHLRRTSSADDTVVRDESAPASPPYVLQIVFTPDMLKDHEPSVHWVSLPRVREVYAAWWIKLSANWTASPAGAGKMTFLHAWPDGEGQVYTALFGSTPPHRVSANTEWLPYGQKVWDPNVTTTPVEYDRWYRIEWYVKWASSPGGRTASCAGGSTARSTATTPPSSSHGGRSGSSNSSSRRRCRTRRLPHSTCTSITHR